MASRDLSQHISPASSLPPQLAAAVVNGSAVDLGQHRGATVLVDLGVFGGTGPNATVQVQDSPDGSTGWTQVAADQLVGGAIPAIDTTNDAQTVERGYLGSRQFLRVAITAITGTSPSLPICALVVRSSPRRLPT